MAHIDVIFDERAPMKIRNEGELVKALQQGESSAFATLVALVGRRLVGSATRILRSRQEAEDVVQETFLAVWKGINRFEGASSLYSWMHRILINNCFAHLRSARGAKEISSSSFDHENTLTERVLLNSRGQQVPTLEKQVAMRRTVEKALQQIPEEFRIVLLLRDVEELSSKEAAELIGISDSLVRQRLHRARSVMAEILRPELCSGPELTCGGQVDLLMDFIDGVLSAEMFGPVDSHIASCEACARLLSDYRGTIDYPKALREPNLNPELSAKLVKRIVEQAVESSKPNDGVAVPKSESTGRFKEMNGNKTSFGSFRLVRDATRIHRHPFSLRISKAVRVLAGCMEVSVHRLWPSPD